MYRREEVKQLLQRHDYVPIIKQWGDGCLVRMPHPRLTRPNLPRLIEAYNLARGSKPGVYYASTFNPDERFVSVPEYAMRLFIMSQVMQLCRTLPVSDEVLVILNARGEEVEQVEEIINPPFDEKE